jgi:hypothetical protein
MDSNQYHRLSAAFLAMADQSNLPDVRDRWRTLAQSCFSLAKERPTKKCIEDRSSKKSMATRIGSRLAIAWCTAQTSAELLVEPLSALL